MTHLLRPLLRTNRAYNRLTIAIVLIGRGSFRGAKRRFPLALHLIDVYLAIPSPSYTSWGINCNRTFSSLLLGEVSADVAEPPFTCHAGLSQLHLLHEECQSVWYPVARPLQGMLTGL